MRLLVRQATPITAILGRRVRLAAASSNSENAGMNLSTLSSTRIAPVPSATIRRFSKAKVIADRLGVCPRTIFRWANAGNFARHKINARVVLFDEAEVAAFIEAARIETTLLANRVR